MGTSLVRVFRWHPESSHCIALEIKLDHHGRFRPNHPAVVSRFDRDRLWRGELHGASVGVLDVDFRRERGTRR
jgi:hypothetical protein